MNRFTNELRVIPRTAWIVGFLLYLATSITIALGIRFAPDPEMSQWPLIAKAALSILAPLFLFIPVGLIGYVHGDAKRRGMRYVMWTLLAIFIPNAIGIILYFILRDALPRPCPQCNMPVKSAFVFCSRCGTEIQRACPSCRRPVEPDWANCGYCGAKLNSSASAST